MNLLTRFYFKGSCICGPVQPFRCVNSATVTTQLNCEERRKSSAARGAFWVHNGTCLLTCAHKDVLQLDTHTPNDGENDMSTTTTTVDNGRNMTMTTMTLGNSTINNNATTTATTTSTPTPDSLYFSNACDIAKREAQQSCGGGEGLSALADPLGFSCFYQLSDLSTYAEATLVYSCDSFRCRSKPLERIANSSTNSVDDNETFDQCVSLCGGSVLSVGGCTCLSELGKYIELLIIIFF